MTRIDFYHLQNKPLDEVLPKLLEKAYATGKKILLKIGNEERVEFLNSLLWTYAEQSFLPHGSKKDGNAELQPIWLTANDDNPNNAELLFLVDGAQIIPSETGKFERIFNVFDGHSEEAVASARKFWKELKLVGHECFYWKQEVSGTWIQI